MGITVLSGPPGCQKTRTMLREMLDQPNLYLLAFPRIDSLEEHAEWIRLVAATRDIAIRIEAIHGKQGLPDVPRRIDDACRALALSDHVVLLITHEALLRLDQKAFADSPRPWHARIDEAPDGLASGVFRAPVAAQYLAQVYDLAPSAAPGWWSVSLKPGSPGAGALMLDTHLRGLVGFDKRARAAGGTLVNIGDWRDATVPKREVQWLAVWTPALLDGFASVVIAAANFKTSLCGLAWERLDPCNARYVERHLGVEGRRARPTVLIYYFTRGHQGSTAWWAESEGKRCLNAVIRHLVQVPDLGFYSGNESVRAYADGWLNHAESVSPKQAGTNSLIRHTSCAYVYSSKSQHADAPIRAALGLTGLDIQRAREVEDLIQFVMRGAIRRPDFCGSYRAFLYDEVQAIALRDYLVASGVTDDVTLEPLEDAGIMETRRPRSAGLQGASESILTHSERATARRDAEMERGRRRRADEKARRQANGIYRGRGRPRIRDE